MDEQGYRYNERDLCRSSLRTALWAAIRKAYDQKEEAARAVGRATSAADAVKPQAGELSMYRKEDGELALYWAGENGAERNAEVLETRAAVEAAELRYQQAQQAWAELADWDDEGFPMLYCRVEPQPAALAA